MVIERNIFHLRFGKAREAIEIWRSILEESKKSQLHTPEMRLLSDLSGNSYTLVLEMHLSSLTDLNQKQAVWATTEAFQELYKKFIPLCEKAEREFLRIEEVV